MGKTKKKGLADKVRNKKKNRTKPQSNLFEIKVNRAKHVVVNKRTQKWEKGTPGISRSKSVKMRKDTLLRELHHMKKSNLLHDKRLGESGSDLTADEMMVQRFALEKKRQMQKGDFSLNEEGETLTHYGQSLAENLQDNVGSDSEEDAATLKTGDLQFGGFSRNGEEGSWKDRMKDVIADSKKHKYERQVEKEKALEATNELNSNWKAVIYNFRPLKKEPAGSKKVSSYLQLFHTLVMEQKSGGGTDKLKTEEEQAKEEAERLQILEAERLSRMKGTENKPEITHMSADDLNDGFDFEKSKSKMTFTDTEQPDEAEEDKSKDEKLYAHGAREDSGDENGDGEEVEDDDDEEDSDNFSDLVSDEDDDSSSEVESKKEALDKKAKTCPVPPKKLKVSKSMKMDLPFIYNAPGSFEELESLLHGHDGEEQAIILSRLRKCHHPSLAEGNKEKLQSIHLYVLQYFGKLVSEQPMDRKLIDYVSICLWEIMQMFKDVTASALQKYITQRQAEFVAVAQKRKGRGLFPSVETLMHLVLIENLFPTSDFRHPVTTPTMHFITQALTECPVKDGKDIVCGLFLCILALKFVALSKRYIPEVVTFLHGILLKSADKHESIVFPPFRSAGKATGLLVIENNCKAVSIAGQWSLMDMMSEERGCFQSDKFKCEAISLTADLMLQCLKLWEELPCLYHVTQPWLDLLSHLPVDKCPVRTKEKLESLKCQIDASSSKKLKVLQQLSSKPEPLRLFEPKIEEFWSGKRKKGGPNRGSNEKQRLNHKYKREMKAAIREIKRDNEVLAKHQLDTMIEKDKERKRKTKELMHSLASQEGDYKAIKRMKN